MCSFKSWETIAVWALSHDTHTHMHTHIYIYISPCSPFEGLINHLIIFQLFPLAVVHVGEYLARIRLAYTMLILAARIKKSQDLQMATLSLRLHSFHPLRLSSFVDLLLSADSLQADLFSSLPCIIISSYSTNWHDLGIMELGQHAPISINEKRHDERAESWTCHLYSHYYFCVVTINSLNLSLLSILSHPCFLSSISLSLSHTHTSSHYRSCNCRRNIHSPALQARCWMWREMVKFHSSKVKLYMDRTAVHSHTAVQMDPVLLLNNECCIDSIKDTWAVQWGQLWRVPCTHF